MAEVTVHSDFGAQGNKICHCLHFFPFYLQWSDRTRCHDLSFFNGVLSQAFPSHLSPSSRGSLVRLHFLPLEWYHLLLFIDATFWIPSVQFSSVTQSCLTLCNPMNRSTPGLPVHHQLPELTQTHVHWVGDAIQPSHPLSSPSPPASNPSKHQGLFQYYMLIIYSPWKSW